MLNVAIHAATNLEWQGRYAHLVAAGLKRHGINPRIVWNAQPQECDVAIIMGPNNYRAIEQSGVPYLMVNRKFLGNDAHNVVAVGWDGFNGDGTFCVDQIDPKRLEQFIDPSQIEDWHKDGEHILLCEQSNLGRSTAFRSLQDFYAYVYATSETRVMLRKKPIGEHQIKPALVRAGLNNAKAVAILNSTISVEALIAGYPVISYDIGDPCYAITGHKSNEIVYPDNRLELFQYMAHCQWTEQEIANGEFWAQLYPKRGPKLHEWSGNNVS